MKKNFRTGVVTSNCLNWFDTHNEHIGLNLVKIKGFKPFL